MKNLAVSFGLVSALALLTLTTSPSQAIGRNTGTAPFQIRIVDEQTRQGVPHVLLTTDNGIRCYTRGDGYVTWGESSLMDRDVYFKINNPGYRFPGGGTTIRVAHGGYTQLEIAREGL